MPPELRQSLEDAAREGSRSLHAEIIARLDQSFKISARLGATASALDALGASQQAGDQLTAKLIEIYEAQAALSKLQQGIIDELLKERQKDQLEGKPSDGKTSDKPKAKPAYKFNFSRTPPSKKEAPESVDPKKAEKPKFFFGKEPPKK